MKIDTPDHTRSTDAIDPGYGSKNITIAHCYINVGDDHVALKGGEGGVTNVTVAHNHFYQGHGMSIGSETYGGARKIRISDLSLDGADFGIRIKSNAARGGLVHDVAYDDICIRNTTNSIELNTAYSMNGSPDGNSFPIFRDIRLHNVRIFGGGKITLSGYSQDYRLGVLLDGVVLMDDSKYNYAIQYADITLGASPVNLELKGVESSTSGNAAHGSLTSCSDKFVAFPR